MGRVWVIGVGALVAAGLVFVGVILVADAANQDVIADRVRIGTLDVGGLDRAKAHALVQRKLAGAVQAPIAATYGGQRFVLRADDARARLDTEATVRAALRLSRRGDPFSRVLGGNDAHGTVRPRLSYSRAAVESFAARIADRVDRTARDADIDWRNGKVIRAPARSGLEVRRPELVTALVGAMTSSSARRTVDAPVRVTDRPDRSLADLAKRYPTVITIDRGGKALRLYKHLRLAHRYPIAVGQAGLETAAGRYEIEQKIVNPPWHVPDSAWAGDLAGQTVAPDDPQNPLKARWMGFHDGEGIHGTDEIASLGQAASHGCIRMSVPDVEQLYPKVRVGTPVFVQ